MKSIGLSEIQKNIGIFSLQKNPWSVIDKRKNQIISFIYPTGTKSSLSKQLSGSLAKYVSQDKKGLSWENIREKTWTKHFSDKNI